VHRVGEAQVFGSRLLISGACLVLWACGGDGESLSTEKPIASVTVTPAISTTGPRSSV
jgi:hypothetical protein